jgi:hypothetical protein
VLSASHDLAVLDQAILVLAQAKSLDEVKAIRDKAEAARNYVKAAKLGLEHQNRAAEIKIRAERKAGMMLRSLRLRGGDRKSKRHDAPLKLQDLGICRDQSKRWQSIARVSEADFAGYLRKMRDLEREITSAGLLRIARRQAKSARSGSLAYSRCFSKVIDNDARQHLLEELKNHCKLLGDVLRPVYEESNLDLERGEKRIIGRLIREMDILITQLQKT